MQIGLSLGRQGRRRAAAAPVHIFVIAGQSNALGRAADDSVDSYPAGTIEYGAGDSWAPVGPRLYHGAWSTDEALALPAAGANFGWDRAFAAAYAAENPGVTVGLIGVADGGTGFVTNQWNKGQPSYTQAVARIAAALAARPAGAVLKGILWHQGENDGVTAGGPAAYDAALMQFLTDFRADTGTTDVPFVLGGHVFATGYYNSEIQRTIQSIPNRVPLTGYADVSSPVEATIFDAVHLDAASLRRFGPQYLRGLKAAAANTGLGGTGPITAGTPVLYQIPGTTPATHTASGLALGTPAPDRLILAAVTCRGTNARWPVSLTIGGVDAVRVGEPASGSSQCGVTLFQAEVPEGATGELAVAFSGSVNTNQSAVLLLPVYGARPGIATNDGFGSAKGGTAHGTALGCEVDVAAGDLVFAAAAGIASSSPAATGTLNLAGSQTLAHAGSNMCSQIGFAIAAAAEDGRAVTASFSKTVNYPSVAAMVLRPR
ncbi:sialate O-acetylesterase [Frigidibacter oleivorans]|uniref:sialate O-acetylesterase n=1 Tax=Frigidibacter oleivorans TaxID=2487129 RepID=UPI000F8C9648|nr:sialate O-acetylesterase [Frigidibacter oleivorans]